MASEIKPCKCGGNGRVSIGYVIGLPIFYRVVCDKCSKSTKVADTEHEAINLWNGGAEK